MTEQSTPESWHIPMGPYDEAFAAAFKRQLARFGCQTVPVPAEREAAELVALIREISLAWQSNGCLLGNMTAGQLTALEDSTVDRAVALHQAVQRARAALDEPAVPEGRKPAAVEGQPSDQEVGEMAKWLHHLAAERTCNRRRGIRPHPSALTRAAALLEQLSAFQPQRPIPVSERLPGDQLCWWFESDEDCGYGSTWTLLRIRGSATGYTHWLPANALPLPEAQP